MQIHLNGFNQNLFPIAAITTQGAETLSSVVNTVTYGCFENYSVDSPVNSYGWKCVVTKAYPVVHTTLIAMGLGAIVFGWLGVKIFVGIHEAMQAPPDDVHTIQIAHDKND